MQSKESRAVERRRTWPLTAALVGGGVLVAGGVVAVYVFAGDKAGNWMSGVLAGLITAFAVPFALWAIGRLRRAYRGGGTAEPITGSVLLHSSNTAMYPGIGPVPESGHTVQVTVQALVNRAVVLSGLRAEVLDRGPAGTLESVVLGHVDVRRFDLMLDADPPVVEPRQGEAFPYTVGPDDPEVFEISAHTDGSVAWLLHFDWIDQGRTGSTRLDLAGEPFRTAASKEDA